MTTIRRMLAGAAALLLASAALTGCSRSSAGAAGGPTLSVFTGASGAFTENYNPFSASVLPQVQGIVYESLFFFNGRAPLGTKPVPLLGSSYEWNDKGTELTITTKSGITWSDGKPFTARDVAFTVNLIRDTPAINTLGSSPSAKASGDDQVVLTFDKPSFTIGPNVLGRTYIVPEHIWKAKKDPAKDPNKSPVGTGPMKVTTFTPQSFLLKKNAKYRDAGKVRVGGLRVLSLAGNGVATSKLLAGQIDWAGIFVPDVDKVLKTKPFLGRTFNYDQAVVLDTCSNVKLGCTGPQTDRVVRQAMSAALNREQVNKLAYYGNAVPISSTFAIPGRDDQFIAPEFKGVPSTSPDIAKAKQLLEDAGWSLGSDGIYAKAGKKLSMKAIVTSGFTDYIASLQAVQQQLKAAGIDIDVQQVSNQETVTAAQLGKYELLMNAVYQGPVADPYYVYSNFFSTKNTGKVGASVNPYANVVRYSNPEVDRAVETAAGTEDLKVKAAAYATIQKRIVEDLPYIPIIDNKNFSEYSTKQVTGWPTDKNPYAQLQPASGPDNAQVLLRLRPVK